MNPIAETVQMFSVTDVPAIFSKSLEQITQSVLKLNASLVILDTRIERSNSLMLQTKISAADRYQQNGIARPIVVPAQKSEGILTDSANNEKPASAINKLKEYTEIARGVGKIGSGSIEMAEAFGWGEKVGKLKKYVTGFNALTDVAEAVSATAEATTAIDVVAASTEIIAGAESVAAAFATFGSVPGLLIGAGVLAVGGTAAYMMSAAASKTRKHEAGVAEEAVAAGNGYFLSEQKSALTAHRKAGIIQDKENDIRDRSELTTKILSQGAHLVYDRAAAIKDANYTPTFLKVLDRDLVRKKRKIADITFANELDREDFIRNSDPGMLYKTKVDPFKTMPPPAWSKQIEVADQLAGPRIVRSPLDKTKELPSALETIINAVDMERNEYAYGYIGMLAKSKDPKDREKAKTLQRQVGEAKNITTVSSREGTSSIQGNTINLNRSLIEHFTINVKDSGEGIKDLKRKVEEVLLEVLNSITAK